MNFERGKDPHRQLRIGNGRAKKMFWVSMGGGFKMSDESVLAMIKHWQQEGVAPDGIYLLIEKDDNKDSFVHPSELSGELIEWKNQYYQLP